MKEGTKIWHIVITTIAYLVLAVYVSNQDMELINEYNIKLEMIIVIWLGIFLALSKICSGEVLKKNKRVKKFILGICVFAMFIISTENIAVNSMYSMRSIKEKGGRINQNIYAKVVDGYEGIIENLKNYDDSLYRIEKSDNVTANDALVFGYNGACYSGSSYSKNLHAFLKKLGVRVDYVHVQYNLNTTKVADMLLGIKYLILTPGYDNKKGYEVVYEEPFLEDNAKIVKNPYYLSLGYEVNEKIFDTNLDEGNTFELQNIILKNMTGLNEDVYIKHEGEIKFTVEGFYDDRGVYRIIKDEADTEESDNVEDSNNEKVHKITYEFEVEKEDQVYAYLVAECNDKIKIFINDEEVKRDNSYIEDETVDLGKRQIGEKVKLEMVPEGDCFAGEIHIYYENEEVLKKHYKLLSENEVRMEKINDTKYIANVNVENDEQLVMFTIPYDEGWKIKENAERLESVEVLDNLIGVRLDKGEHEISLEYELPKMKVGVICSLIGGIVWFVLLRIRKKKFMREF